MESLFDCVKKFFLAQGFDRTYWVAYSGGLDSHVLLHLCAELCAIYPIKLRAIHINHGLSPNATAWSTHCENNCRDLQINLTQKSINAKATTGKSPEDIARLRRYEIFAELLMPNDFLLTAHQQDDQAETVLLQMLRGAGPKGLAAMPQIKAFARGFQARPLLDFTRAELQSYAEQNQLCWIDDESNTNVSFTRNFLRHDVIPILKKRWPTVTNTLARVAENCAEAQQLLDLISANDLAAVKGSEPNTLSTKKLLALDSARQRQVLRAWLNELHFPIPSVLKMRQIQENFLLARADKLPHIVWADVELRRYRDVLYAMRCLPLHDATQVVAWNLQQPLELTSGGVLQAKRVKGQGLLANISAVSVRFRQGGEQVRLPGRRCHHELKKIFQEQGILPWQRERVPLIYVGDQLAAAVGIFVAESFIAQGNEEGYLLSHTHT